MIISLDYDHTFTEDPDGWLAFAKIMKSRGHEVLGVTMRHPAEASGMDSRYDEACTSLHFTGRKGKRAWLLEKGVEVDVWVDDTPEYLLADAWTP